MFDWAAYALGAVLGAVAGSFIGVVADRWPRGEGFVGGRSHCQSCHKALRAWHMVPLASYGLLRARCAYCAARLPVDLLLAEVGGAVAVVVAMIAAPTLPGVIAWALFGLVLVLLALLGARHLWLPDALTLPLIALGPLAAWVLPAPDLTQRLAGGAGGYASLALVRLGYYRWRGYHGLGGGDPKLFAAIGMWLGIAALPGVLLVATLLALGHALVLYARGTAVGAQTALPLGTPLALAALAAIVWV